MEHTHLFVINPIAGGTDKNALYHFLEEEIGSKTVGFRIYETSGHNDEEAITELLEQNAFRVVIAAGGDGTVMLVARLLLDRPEILGIIPLGSANGMARELGLLRTLDPVRSLITRERIRRAWDIIRQAEVLEMDAVRINGQFISLHLSDIGLNAKIVKRFEKGKLRGFRGYARQFFREMPLRDRISYRITTDDKRHRGRAYMIVIANATMYGTGAVINPGGRLDDGMVELCIVKDINIKGLLKALLSIFKKDVRYEKKDLRVIRCQSASITLKHNQALQIDGEVMGDTDRVEVEVMPRCVKVIR